MEVKCSVVSVRETITLKEFKAFKLITGESGLDNQVSSIGILDYEYALQDGDKPRKWTFRKRDFVISSLLFAKGHPELLSVQSGTCVNVRCCSSCQKCLL